MDIQDIADDVSKDIGKKISPKKRDFALLKAIEPDMTNTDIAKQIANTKHPTQDGYKLAVDPSVQALVEKYQEVIQFSRFKVDPEFIKSGWMKEVLEAKDSRDRRGALDSLAKSEGMFKEIVEHHNFESDQEFLKKLETELGSEAAKIAAIELGLDWNG